MQIDLKPEDRLSIQFADRLREFTSNGRYQGVWLHVPNERKAHVFTMIILKAMGQITGAWDYVFMGPWGCGWIELKQGTNTLGEYQRYFRFWLRKWDIPHEECRTLDQAIAALKKWGALSELPSTEPLSSNQIMPVGNQSSLPAPISRP